MADDGFTVVRSKGAQQAERKRQQQALLDGVYKALGGPGGIGGWTAGSHTVVHALNAQVTIGQLSRLPAHLTVNQADLDLALAAAQGTDATAAFKAAVKQVPYHVTVEVSDNRNGGKEQLRWRSDQQGWSVDGTSAVKEAFDAGGQQLLQQLAAAVVEAGTVIKTT